MPNETADDRKRSSSKSSPKQLDPLRTMINSARAGDVRYAREVLLWAGLTLNSDKPLDPILREYIGEKLVEIAAVTRESYEKTEHRAIAIGKALGLVGTKGQKPKRFHQTGKDYIVAALVIREHGENNKPLTREGAFRVVANAKNMKASAVERAYYRVKNRGLLEDPVFMQTLRNMASFHAANPKR